MISNIKYNKGGYSMNLESCKLVFVVSPSDDGDKSLETVKEVIEQLIKDDKKNKRDNLIYISSLNTFGWLSDTIDKEDRMNYSLKLLTQCNELYVLPNYELDEELFNSFSIKKLKYGRSLMYVLRRL